MATTKFWTLIFLILMIPSTIIAAGTANISMAAGTLHGPCSESASSTPCQTLHSICVNNTCQCASPYSPRNGFCYFAPGEATVNNPCVSNTDCYGQGEFCSYGSCRCLRTHVEIDRHCLPVIYPGQSGCDDSRQCSAASPGSVCRNRFCECPGGSMASGQTCVQNGLAVAIGTMADASTPSSMIHYEVEVAQRRAAPNGRSHGARGVINYQAIQPRPPGTSAVGFGTVPPGGVCSQDQECAGNPFAYCMSTCMCRDGAINAGSTCLEPGSTSRGNCGTGQVYVSEAGACMNIARPGEPCQYSQQCSGTEVGAFCVNLRCRCVYGMVVTGDGRCTFINSNCTTRGTVWISELGECKPVIAPGARTCTHRQQCIASFPDSMCFLTQCTCPEGTPVAVDGTCGTACSSGQTFSGVLGKCVPTVQPGDRCQYSSQCHAIYPGMICDKGICRCPNNQMWTGSACSASCPSGYMMNPKSGMCRPACRSTQLDHEGECLDLVAPEQPCQISRQCQGGSTCTNRMCTCPSGTQNLHGTCSRASSPPGGPCGAGEYCVGGSYCDNGICTCPLGTVKANQQCVTPANVPPNSPCGPTVQCSGNSVCINGACVCPEGQISINGFCAIPPSVPPGYPCSLSDRCTLGSVCQNGICQCPTGTFLSENRCLVPMQVPPGAACRTGTELCTGLSSCVNNICACPTGMIPQGAMCRTPPLVSPGSSCANQERCGGGAECVGNVCMCPPGTKIVNLQCQFMASVPPNFSCANGEICIGGSQCQDGICRCPAGQAAFNQVCQYSSAGIGSPCMSNDQCTGGSTCVSNVCTCRRGQMWVNGLCTAANSVPPGSYCHETALCSGGSRCISGRCMCRRGEVARRNECVPIRVLVPGAYCQVSAVDQQCTGGSTCVSGTCTCPPGTVAFGEECINQRRVPPLSSCAGGELCIGGSQCQNGVCTCPSGTVIRNQECGQPLRVPPGSPCPTGTEICTGGSTCTRGVCECPAGQTVRDQFCSLPPMVPYNFVCVHDGECVGGASCLAGVCICPNSTLLVDGICQTPIVNHPNPYPTPANRGYSLPWPNIGYATPWPSFTAQPRTSVFLGVGCGNGEMCIGGAFCQNGVCVCPGNSIAVGNRCLRTVPAVPPGSACSSSDTCGGGSVCIDRLCVCPPNYSIVSGACRPTPTVSPTASCANGERCGGGSTCIRDVCTCPADQVVINQQCQNPPVVPPGSSCMNAEVCGGGSVCAQGKCTCPSGTTQSGKSCKNVFMSTRNQNCPLPENPAACSLPNCYCSRTGTQVPGNFTSSDVPQMVVLSIDDALNGRTMTYLKRLFDGRFKNPNGCEIKATFFVSHEWNNYDEVQWLYYNGHEIAVNSISHQTLSNEPVERWSQEMSGMRSILQQLSGLAPDSIKGVRAPQLAPGGNSQFEMMHQDGFEYDNSMSANPGKDGPAFWPQTLDFQIPWRCEVEPCPDRSFPGLWVIPINQFFGYYLPEIQEHKRGAMVRAAMADAPKETIDTLYNMLLDNFNRVYRSNRAPYVITLDAAFFQTLPNNGSMEALERFVMQVLRTPDVWVVTEKQILDWMRRPTPNNQLASFAPWQCSDRKPENAAPCQTPQRCSYQTQLPFGERWFKTCFTCPASYPWLNNPSGTRRK